jgi:hypothetical protein
MFHRLAMRSIQARAGISTDTDKIGARLPRRSNAKAGGPMDSDELTSFIGVAHQNPACQSREAALVSGHE